MKLTKTVLKQIIREEIQKLDEALEQDGKDSRQAEWYLNGSKRYIDDLRNAYNTIKAF